MTKIPASYEAGIIILRVGADALGGPGAEGENNKKARENPDKTSKTY